MQLIKRFYLFFFFVTNPVLRDNSTPVLSDKPAGLCSKFTHFSMCEWDLLGMDGGAVPAPHRAQYTWTQGECTGLSQRFSSLFVISPLQPPALPPCRLCEWVRQTSWLRDLLGRVEERRYQVIPSGRLRQTLCSFFPSYFWSCLTIHNAMHKWFCAASHNRPDCPGAAEGRVIMNHVIRSEQQKCCLI